VTMKIIIFWDIMPYSLVVHWHFKGIHCLHLQGKKLKQEMANIEARGKQSIACCLLLNLLTLWPWWWRQCVPLNRVLRGMFGPNGDEVIGWRKLHNELHNLYCSSSIIRMIKSRRMRWEGHVARMGRRGMHIWFWWESQKERDH
jgi:hypothetical protein